MLGFDSTGLLGITGYNGVFAVKITTTPTISSIDSSFQEAREYLKYSDYAYIAVSPYVFLLFSEYLIEKLKELSNQVGLLLVDKYQVISIIKRANKTSHNKEKYEMIKKHFSQSNFLD